MSLIRTLCRCMCGGLGLLLFAGASPLQTETPPQTRVTAVPDSADPVEANPVEANPAATPPTGTVSQSAPATADPCVADQACVDNFLWSLYERTPKIDTIKVPERKKVKVKRKGKTRTVTRTVTKLVTENFAWKDEKAAEIAEMSLMDYVIGGMDPEFRVTLYRALRALDDAGFKPGIMCAFRDDYRQSIATGIKAQDDRSYHGGSFRGGYGHGLAADIVSVKGDTPVERSESTGKMWDWIDAHEMELGIGRPYLNRDPPHVAPLDGEEYADHRLLPKIERAESEAKRKQRHEAHNDRNVTKHADRGTPKRTKVTHPTRAQSKPRAPAI